MAHFGAVGQGSRGAEAVGRDIKSACIGDCGQGGEEALFDFVEGLVVMGFLGAGDGRGNSGEVQFDHPRIEGIRRIAIQKEPLESGIAFDEGAVGRGAASHAQVGNGFSVHGEKASRGTVFWRHIGEHGAVGQGEAGDAGTKILDELSDNIFLPQELGHDEGEVGGGNARAEGAGETHTVNDGGEQGDGLAQHGGLGLDAANTPAKDAKTVNHSGVRIGTNKGVGIG